MRIRTVEYRHTAGEVSPECAHSSGSQLRGSGLVSYCATAEARAGCQCESWAPAGDGGSRRVRGGIQAAGTYEHETYGGKHQQ